MIVYNIITDFALALFPWLVTWKLRIKKIEKIGICVTMSLGVLVAIMSTWRTAYMMSDSMNTYDIWYFRRQGLSMVWYIAEVACTIIVQTLPIVRHLVRDTTQQKTLVSVKLNEVSNLTTTCWSGTQRSETDRQDRGSQNRGRGDEEQGLNNTEPWESVPLNTLLVPSRRSGQSWSTYSPSDR